MIRLILVRHAECEANAREIITGHSDYKLTCKGDEQAKKVGLRLKDEKVDIAFVSDAKRATDTAKEILKHHKNVNVVYDSRLRERNYGIFEGTVSGSVSKAAEKAGVSFNEFKPDKGESIKELNLRVIDFFEEMIKKEDGKTVLVISHGGPILEIFFHLLNVPRDKYREYHPGNTAVTILEIDVDKKHKVHALNCTNHLN